MAQTHHFTVVDTYTPLREAFELWLESLQARQASPKTIRGYRSEVGAFIRFLEAQGITSLEEVQALHIRKWLIHRQAQGVSPAQLHHDWRKPRTFWRWALREELVAHDAFAKAEAPKLRYAVKPCLTPEQVDALLNACEGKHWTRLRDKALLLVLLDTGARASEVHSLTVESANRETVWVQGKGGKQRPLFLSPATRLALRRYLNSCPFKPEPNQPLWWGKRGALTLWGMLEVIEKIGKRTGISPLGAHVFRRTHAVWSLRSGLDLARLQKMLGHSSVSVLVKHYLPLLESDLREAHRQYSPVNTLLHNRKPRESR
ncbi:MAG: tyrosine-type recombinase/integrase [bacterium]|nr:tyrosine-type recombinase/integrase [bacterium]